MRYFFISVLFLIVNLIYASYAIKVSKEYTKKLSELRFQKERELKLHAKIEERINYSVAKEYVKRKGFVSIDW
ncbi:MAG: hypothetical protein ACK4SM_00585, partial [Aquificaceae bacterium]